MRPTLAATAEKRLGIFARHEALAAGYSRREFERMTGGPASPWIRVRYGIYAVRATWEALSDLERAILLDESALVVCDPGTVLSHSSAARRLGIPLYDADDGLTHVTRVRTDGRILSRIQSGVKHHCGALEAVDVMTCDGRTVTDPIRTVLDLTCEFGYRCGLVAADAVLHCKVSKDELIERAIQREHLCHRPVLRAVAEDADGRAESPLETLGRILLVRMGITDLEPQFQIERADGRMAAVDLYSTHLHHVFECDGKTKYRDSVDADGVMVKASDVVWREKKREDAIRGLGFGFSRFGWYDVMLANFSATSARLRREIQQQDAAGRRARHHA